MLANIKEIMLKRRVSELEDEIRKKQINIEDYDKQIAEIQNEINILSSKLDKERKRFFNRLVSKIVLYKSKAEVILNSEIGRLKNKKFKMGNEQNLLRTEIEKLQFDIKKIEDSVSMVSTESNLSELKKIGLDFKTACEVLKENNIPFILDESDLHYSAAGMDNYGFSTHSFKAQPKNTVDLSVMKDYVLIHKTNYHPKGGRIKTRKEAAQPEVRAFALDKLGSVEFAYERNTIHFAVNGEVGSHHYGNWDGCKYAVLIPFPDMPVSQLRCGAVMDTYIEGGLNLPDSAIILCPIEEQNIVKAENPNQTVVGYNGQLVTKYADAMSSYLGYKIEHIGMWSWMHGGDMGEYYKKLEQTGLDIHVSPHTGTIEKAREDGLPAVKSFIVMIKRIIENNILLSNDDLKTILNDNLIYFGTDDRLEFEIRDLLNKELSPYGINVPLNFNEFYKSNFDFRGIGFALRLNIINQAMQIVDNNLKNDKKRGL